MVNLLVLYEEDLEWHLYLQAIEDLFKSSFKENSKLRLLL